ncbi:asparagine synthase-related protein [Roseiarcaceae bacterium H3SJ34-1]|uniref:asparagine synthetase B family protein n=1 Tax=Terripilifer ovatus TaxID=3032367 RepID=UPI003AB94E7D|nr:asparagine synthase-related protein [Roseiarcaceae bacterium H3SJ34-1]
MAALRFSEDSCLEAVVSGARLAACDGASISPHRDAISAAFDGRIDNGAELRRALNIGATEALTSADIALYAYRAWGDGFCHHIIGDYSCVIWDAALRRLVMATDPGAMRPLFYWTGSEEILFATEQRGLLADRVVPRQIDEHQLAAWLTLLPRDVDRSFFAGIHRVPPGHVVVWQGGSACCERWWKPETVAPLKLATDADYEAVLRDGLDQAVRCRLDGNGTVGANLSGGLDSSSVAAMAARALGEQGQRLTAFTAAPTHPAIASPGWFDDEWPYAAALAAQYPNVDHVRIANDNAPLIEAMESREAGQDWPLLNPVNAIWVNGIDRAARDRGLGVMLVAATGNYSISHHGSAAYSQQIRDHRFGAAFNTARALRRVAGRSWLGLAREAAASLLPEGAARALRQRQIGRTPVLEDYSVINRDFLSASGLEMRARTTAGELSNLTGGDSRALRILALQRNDHLGLQFGSSRRLFGLDVRDPTSDRRLVELCLAIPDERFSRDGIPRNLIRQAMKGLVPAMILNERRRGRQAADWRCSFDQALPYLKAEVARLRDSPLASRALDLDRIGKLLDAWPGTETTGNEAAVRLAYRLAVLRGIAAGRFVRRMELVGKSV